jgi:hypothetical protein
MGNQQAKLAPSACDPITFIERTISSEGDLESFTDIKKIPSTWVNVMNHTTTQQ